MPITRKYLKALGIEDEKVDEIIEAHTETINAIKNDLNTITKERDDLKANSSNIETITKERDELKEKLEKAPNYEALEKKYNDFVEETNTKAKNAKINNFTTSKLKELGFNEKAIPLIMKDDLFKGLTVENDDIKGFDDIQEKLKENYSDFVTTTENKGSKVPVGGKSTETDPFLQAFDEEFE